MVEIPNSCTVILFLILGTSGAWKEESYLTYLRWVKSILYEDEDDFTAETCNDNVKAEIVLAVPADEALLMRTDQLPFAIAGQQKSTRDDNNKVCVIGTQHELTAGSFAASADRSL
jgi:hypothetical protein